MHEKHMLLLTMPNLQCIRRGLWRQFTNNKQQAKVRRQGLPLGKVRARDMVAWSGFLQHKNYLYHHLQEFFQLQEIDPTYSEGAGDLAAQNWNPKRRVGRTCGIKLFKI